MLQHIKEEIKIFVRTFINHSFGGMYTGFPAIPWIVFSLRLTDGGEYSLVRTEVTSLVLSVSLNSVKIRKDRIPETMMNAGIHKLDLDICRTSFLAIPAKI